MAKNNYDKDLESLRAILGQLQAEDMGIEEMRTYVKKARTLAESCKNRLREIEEDLHKLDDAEE